MADTRMLTREPVHPYTDRECASLLGSLLGGLLIYAEPIDVKTALEFLLKHFDEYVKAAETIRPIRDKLV